MTRKQFYTYLEQTFDSFTKTVIKTKSIDILREYSRQAEREVPLSDMTPAEIGRRANVTDTYRLYRRAYTVRDYVIHVYDGQFAIERQKKQLERYAKINGLQISGFYSDCGYSGNDFERPGFQKLQRAWRAGKFEAVIVIKKDRLCRGKHTYPAVLPLKVISLS